ncbi:MAG: phosphate ABC transporter permease PstA [Acidimicrobiia bacterium]|nr:phosphate ABC transporter permease PstA [Acidimicrobiia bacterium]
MGARIERVDTAAVVRGSLQGRRFNPGGLAFEASLLLMLLVSLAVLVTLLADIIGGAIPVFRDRGLDFVTSGITLDSDTAGVWTGLLGSVAITLVVAVVAFPMGIGAAIYLEEYAPGNSMTRFIQTNIRNLAGVPSIVYGLLGLAVFVRLVDLIGLGGSGSTAGRNVVSAGITLAVLVLPIVIITASEALRAVPDAIREAGFGVGATRWEVVRHHVLPAAAPGVLTGTVLALARAFGETAPLLVIGVATGFFSAGSASVFDRLTGTYTALPVVVLSWSRQADPAFKEHLAPAAILVLLVVLFVANAAAITLRNKYDRDW